MKSRFAAFPLAQAPQIKKWPSCVGRETKRDALPPITWSTTRLEPPIQMAKSIREGPGRYMSWNDLVRSGNFVGSTVVETKLLELVYLNRISSKCISKQNDPNAQSAQHTHTLHIKRQNHVDCYKFMLYDYVLPAFQSVLAGWGKFCSIFQVEPDYEWVAGRLVFWRRPHRSVSSCPSSRQSLFCIRDNCSP